MLYLSAAGHLHHTHAYVELAASIPQQSPKILNRYTGNTQFQIPIIDRYGSEYFYLSSDISQCYSKDSNCVVYLLKTWQYHLEECEINKIQLPADSGSIA